MIRSRALLPPVNARTARRSAASWRHCPRSTWGEAFVDHYVRTRDWEVRQYERTVTEWEFRRYFEAI
jgi:glutamine synthetase